MESRYNKDLGAKKMTLLYPVSSYIRVNKIFNIETAILMRATSKITLYNRVLLYLV